MSDELVAGRYRIIREIGRGGGGAVWLAQDERLGRLVALKRIHAMGGESSLEVARGMREARLAAALQHENIVAVFDVLEDGDAPWLVMEYVEGPSLATMIETDGWLPPAEVADLGAQIAAAMSRAHEAHIMHRDIKPANILVARGNRAKLADFGIARAEHDERLTQHGMTSGTALYFSPELADGHEPTPMSDVWALGATLYYAVEGRPPVLDAGSPLATLRRIATTPPDAPRNAGPLAGVLAGMLDANPRTRLTMPEAERRLRAVASGRPEPSPRNDGRTTVLPAGRAEGVDYTTGGYRRPAPNGTVEYATGPVPARQAYPPQPGHAEAPRAGSGFGATQEPRRRSAVIPVLLGLLLLALLAAGGLYYMTQVRRPTSPAPVTVTTTNWHTEYVDGAPAP